MSQFILPVRTEHKRPAPRPEQQRLQPREVCGMCGLTISYVYMGNRLQDFHINNNKTMNEKNEYNKRTYTKRERERERAFGQKKKKKKEKRNQYFL